MIFVPVSEQKLTFCILCSGFGTKIDFLHILFRFRNSNSKSEKEYKRKRIQVKRIHNNAKTATCF